MKRLLFCLPLCLLVAPDRYRPDESDPPTPPEGTFAIVADTGAPLPDDATMRALAQRDPMAFLEWCIRRCHREVKAVRLILRKHERTFGTPRLPEEIAVDYRVKPLAVLFHWLKNPPDLAGAALFAPDDLPGKLLIQPRGPFGLGGLLGNVVGNVQRDVRGTEARKAGRYSLEEFGFEMAMRRTLGSWRRAVRNNALTIDFEGIRPCAELGGRPCYVFHRRDYPRPEETDGVNDLVIYIDCATWLQTGSIIKNANGDLLGSYFFSDLQINPPFQADRFKPAGLTQPPPAGI